MYGRCPPQATRPPAPGATSHLELATSLEAILRHGQELDPATTIHPGGYQGHLQLPTAATEGAELVLSGDKLALAITSTGRLK